MSVLVNGSPTKEFTVERGLRQGDPLSPFLFVLVVEGLKVMVDKAVQNGDFVGCDVKGINFNKSKLIGININSRFLDVATSFLSCKREEKEFSFLGIQIGSNPRRVKFWSPLVENIRRRLSSWKGRWLSFGGRITLLKSVLGSLPIFTLSFYLAPKKKWRILEDFNSIWYRMLKARYEDIKLRMFIEGGKIDSYGSKSVWWSDILSLEKRMLVGLSVDSVSFRIGDGYSISFWHSLWMEDGILKLLFPSLFAISFLQEVSVACMGA
ncbi:uncharacterized protein LOC131597917 [Vicia villosa]|uniref:uncharacterized protein LOC131597917 n=1 Tax=Vicia villosa TaxID=3911 RepID=UPI00273ACB59|nr:uncharacterized protein LOC131597917 [Vicia villosa]